MIANHRREDEANANNVYSNARDICLMKAEIDHRLVHAFENYLAEPLVLSAISGMTVTSRLFVQEIFLFFYHSGRLIKQIKGALNPTRVLRHADCPAPVDLNCQPWPK